MAPGDEPFGTPCTRACFGVIRPRRSRSPSSPATCTCSTAPSAIQRLWLGSTTGEASLQAGMSFFEAFPLVAVRTVKDTAAVMASSDGAVMGVAPCCGCGVRGTRDEGVCGRPDHAANDTNVGRSYSYRKASGRSGSMSQGQAPAGRSTCNGDTLEGHAVEHLLFHGRGVVSYQYTFRRGAFSKRSMA